MVACFPDAKLQRRDCLNHSVGVCLFLHAFLYVLIGDLEALEKSYERRLEAQKLEYEEQIYQLRQENFVLDSKVRIGKIRMPKKLLQFS